MAKVKTRTSGRLLSHAAKHASTVRETRPRRFIALGAFLLSIGAVALAAALTLNGADKYAYPPATAQSQLIHRAPVTSSGHPYRAFKSRSWWNTPLPTTAPQNPAGDAILSYLRTAPESGAGCLALAGAGKSRWGQPIYWARPTDPSYEVEGIVNGRPPELDRLRIPVGAHPADNTDGSMSIFDLHKGYVTLLTDATYDPGDDQWSATGATVTYLDSNGLNVLTGRSDSLHNTGTHRGNNGATAVVRWDMVQAGAVNHVLKVASGPELSDRWVFPMVRSDGNYDGADPAVPPEGLRLRIKPSVDLKSINLHPNALVIARALQRYGFYLGDSGGVTALKVEDTVSEGRGQLWDVTSEDLCGLPFTPDYWDVLPEGYDPSRDR